MRVDKLIMIKKASKRSKKNIDSLIDELDDDRNMCRKNEKIKLQIKIKMLYVETVGLLRNHISFLGRKCGPHLCLSSKNCYITVFIIRQRFDQKIRTKLKSQIFLWQAYQININTETEIH